MSRTRVFFRQQYDTTFWQLPNGRFSPNSATTRETWVKRRIRTEIYEKFPFRGHFPPKPPTLRGSNRSLRAGYRSRHRGLHCREILFIPRCSPRAREFAMSVNFFVGRTVVELRGFKVAQFADFGLFSPYKTRKRTFRGDQPTGQGLHRRMIPIFPCGSRRSKGVPSCSGVFLRLLVGKLWTPKLAQIFAYGKWL